MKGVEQVFAENPSKSAAFYMQLYKKLSIEQRAEFEALPVIRQIGLMNVPIRRQNMYKKSGVNAYLISKPKQRNTERMTKSLRATEREGFYEDDMLV